MIETMQKRINEIKQQDRKSYYEIANEIGISESTLYKLMSKGELFTPAEQKITAYLKGYLTKDEKLEAYRMDNEEIKAANERLKEELRTEKIYNSQIEELEESLNHLKQENERLKEEINKLGKKHEDYCNTMYWQMKEQMDKYRQTLQEIKAIVCGNYEIIDPQGRKDILKLITKAEEE